MDSKAHAQVAFCIWTAAWENRLCQFKKGKMITKWCFMCLSDVSQ